MNALILSAPAGRNSASPLDIDNSGGVNHSDQAALNAALPAGYGQSYDYLLTEVDEVHFRTHELHDEALLRVVSKLVPGWMFGGDDNDFLHAFSADDLLVGGAGNDTIHGSHGDDEIWGGEGDDWLHGEEGDDQLHGEAGDDYLSGGPGEDTFDGGPGNNTYQDDYLVANPQIVAANEDTATAITLTATDPENDPLTFAIIDQPQFGTLTGSAPNLSYTPNDDFYGTDSFTFRASDGTHQSNIAVVTINVTPVNDAPTWLEPPTLVVEQDGYPMLLSLGTFFGDIDDRLSDLALTILSNTNSSLVTASVTDLGDLELYFGANLYGDATLELKAVDPGGLFDVGELDIHVNAPPAPTTPAGVPIEVSDCGYPTVLSVYDFFEDPEEADAALEYAITDVTNFDMFDDFSFDPQTGEVTLVYASAVGGTSAITLRAWDSYGAMGVNSFLVTTLCGNPVPVTATILKVEFIPFNDNLDKTSISSENAARYGALDEDSNPNGADTAENKLRGAWIQPGYKGGDRFFPDATAAEWTIGRNVVRVRATLEGAEIGASVWFRSFDVDDPSDEGYDAKVRTQIDPNANGNDNRGRMASVHEAADSAEPNATGKVLAGSGRLRPVGASNAFGAWGNSGQAVKATVKALTNAAGEMIDEEGNVVAAAAAVKIAEVDLATTYAPGDNFRVAAAVQKPENTDAVIAKAMNALSTDKVPTNGPTELPPTIKVTPQLAIWRTLWIEDDTTTNVRTLMSEGSTNRQENRFADAFLEPAYLQGALNSTPLPPRLAVEVAVGVLRPADQTAIDAARDSKSRESDAFWAVYVGDGWTIEVDNRFGMTAGDESVRPWDWSIIFDRSIAALPGGGATALAKTAIHEVGHQLLRDSHDGLDRSGHRGTEGNTVSYYNASNENKANAARNWSSKLNIMTQQPLSVPMDSATANFPVGTNIDGVTAQAGNNAGAVDMFYFFATDIAWMRGRTKSPGK